MYASILYPPTPLLLPPVTIRESLSFRTKVVWPKPPQPCSGSKRNGFPNCCSRVHRMVSNLPSLPPLPGVFVMHIYFTSLMFLFAIPGLLWSMTTEPRSTQRETIKLFLADKKYAVLSCLLALSFNKMLFSTLQSKVWKEPLIPAPWCFPHSLEGGQQVCVWMHLPKNWRKTAAPTVYIYRNKYLTKITWIKAVVHQSEFHKVFKQKYSFQANTSQPFF